MEKHNLMLKALRKSIFWIVIIVLDILFFILDRLLLKEDTHLFTITFIIIITLFFAITEIRSHYKELQEQEKGSKN